MKLNPDCVRDILLIIETTTSFDDIFYYEASNHASFTNLKKYSHAETIYHIRQCNLHGFLYAVDWNLEADVSVQDLTPLGHQFLADIRSDNIWTKTKSVSKKVGSASVSALMQIATGVVTQIIKNELMIP